MLTTLQRLKFFIFFITLTCFGQIQAQDCDQFGVVSRGFLLGKFNCEILIVASDGGTIYQPSKLSDELTPGKLIRFSYTLLDSTDCDESVQVININCVEDLFDPIDSLENTCNFNIESVALVDSTNSTSFQLEVFNQTDFGDYHPQTVSWYEYETGKILGTTPTIIYTPTATSPPTINICADITVAIPNSELCSSTICHTIVPETIFPEESNCQALFVYQPEDQLSDNGTINFYNLSYGDYDYIEWDFGDGQKDTTNDLSLTHIYEQPGLYEVCLTLEKELGGCTSSFCLPVFTVGGSAICSYNDCVFPGDANKDGFVNIFDVLNLGIGFGKIGEIRPNAAITPILQAAFDWDIATLFDLNFKHIDCDGNGLVNIADYEAIDRNYQAITAKKNFEIDATLPEVSLVFPADTIRVNRNQTNVSIPANLVVGTNTLAVDNLYGIALAADYDKSLISSVNVKYDSTSFIGATNILGRKKLLVEHGQVAYAVTRTNQMGVNGIGNIAEFAFILDLDIIEARSESLFEVEIIDLIMVDTSGREIPVSVSNNAPAITVIFDENLTTTTEGQLVENQFDIYPNPAQDRLVIDLAKGLNVADSKVEIFNSLGQKVIQQSLQNNQTILEIGALKTGVYWVSVFTKEGVGIREIVVE